VFSWNIGRIRYLPFVASGLPASSPPTLWYEATGLAGRKLRRSMLGQVSATTSGQYEPQFFPFEIYRDVYGQAVLPENLGFVDYLGSPDGVNPIDVMLANAKRNRVLRDNWASFYFHPFFMQRPGAAADLDRLLKGLQALGYEFVDLERFIERRRWAIRR
jgi:peptidoglycan/xylan/chitin deacetylase (PgdA/CDA1 family)